MANLIAATKLNLNKKQSLYIDKSLCRNIHKTDCTNNALINAHAMQLIFKQWKVS